MCGLAGYISTMVTNPRQIRARLTELLELNEPRGMEATGIGIVDNRGGVTVLKAPISAGEFVKLPDYQSMFVGDVRCILGHTRYPTIGSPENSANNHPIITKKLAGTHNGWIVNACQLKHRYGLRCDGDVDSEVIFRLLEIFPVEQLQTLVRGEITLAWVNRKTAVLHLYRDNNPLYLSETAEGIFWSSTADEKSRWVKIPQKTHLKISLREGVKTMNDRCWICGDNLESSVEFLLGVCTECLAETAEPEPYDWELDDFEEPYEPIPYRVVS